MRSPFSGVEARTVKSNMFPRIFIKTNIWARHLQRSVEAVLSKARSHAVKQTTSLQRQFQQIQETFIQCAKWNGSKCTSLKCTSLLNRHFFYHAKTWHRICFKLCSSITQTALVAIPPAKYCFITPLLWNGSVVILLYILRRWTYLLFHFPALHCSSKRKWKHCWQTVVVRSS